MKKVTISDIAKMAGVSKSTVSRYLNQGYVSQKNKEKIQKAMDETNYQANFFAQALNADRSSLIGVIIPRFASFTANKILTGIDECMKKRGYEIFIASSDLNPQEELKQIQKFVQMGVDGVISMTTKITADHVSLSKESKVPILYLGQSHPEIPTFAIDDYRLGKLAAEYLAKQDFEKVCYLAVSEEDEAVGYYRKKGFIDHSKQEVSVIESDFSFEAAYRKAEMIMDQNCDALVCTTDNMAIAVLRFLLEQNIQVPEEISVLSFGGYDVSAAIHPPLSTLSINYVGFGQAASSYLFNLMEDRHYRPQSNLYEDFYVLERQSIKKGS